MIVPRRRIDELRAVHDRLLALPMTLPDGLIGLAQLVVSALVLSRPITVEEMEPGRLLLASARDDLRHALAALETARAVLDPAGQGDSHDAATHALARLTANVDRVAFDDLHMLLQWEFDPLADLVDQLNRQLDQGMQALEDVRTTLGEITDPLRFRPEDFGRARAAAVVGALDCVEAYERFDRYAVRVVHLLGEHVSEAVFQRDHDPLDPLSVLVR